MHTEFCSESLKGRYRFEVLGTHERIILKQILKMGGCRVQSMGTSGEHV
jgi:hypothetical protein